MPKKKKNRFILRYFNNFNYLLKRRPRRRQTRSQLPRVARRSSPASRATNVNNAMAIDVAVIDVTTVVRTVAPVATTTMPTRYNTKHIVLN